MNHADVRTRNTGSLKALNVSKLAVSEKFVQTHAHSVPTPRPLHECGRGPMKTKRREERSNSYDVSRSKIGPNPISHFERSKIWHGRENIILHLFGVSRKNLIIWFPWRFFWSERQMPAKVNKLKSCFSRGVIDPNEHHHAFNESKLFNCRLFGPKYTVHPRRIGIRKLLMLQ